MPRRRLALPLALCGALALLARSSSAATTTIVAWGDSITYGYYDGTSSGSDCTNGEPVNDGPENCGYPGRLGSRLDDPTKFSPVYDVDLLNLGKGGESTSSALSRFDRASWTCPCTGLGCPINSVKYWVCNGTLQAGDLVVIMEGTNDITSQNISLESIRDNLEALGDKAEALGLNVILSALTPRHPDGFTKQDGCANNGDADAVTLNGKIENSATTRGWPRADPYDRLDSLSNTFGTYYQDWDPMRCDNGVDVHGVDPVGHPNAAGFDKISYNSNSPTDSRTFEYAVRSALPPRLTLTTPSAPLGSGVSLQFSVTLPDLATFGQTVALSWDFGDGTIVNQSVSSSPAAKSHTYAGQGSYSVTVTAEHPNGGTRDTGATVSVTTGPLFADGFESGGTSNWILGTL